MEVVVCVANRGSDNPQVVTKLVIKKRLICNARKPALDECCLPQEIDRQNLEPLATQKRFLHDASQFGNISNNFRKI